MGKNKLRKFEDMKHFDCVMQYPFGVLRDAGGFPLRGKWRSDFFHNEAPIVVELGCGKGEYTIGLAKEDPDKNYIGFDIKGARIWRGAKTATETGMGNVAFVRTGIELLDHFFAHGEVDEIWITFPDPQMQKTRKRLVSARFLELYRKVLRPGGIIHLKTDSPFLYTFACRLAQTNSLPVLFSSADLYASGRKDSSTAIQTFYEQQWLARGKKIKLLSFTLPAEGILTDPEESDIERDDYHSEARGVTFPQHNVGNFSDCNDIQ